MSPRTGRPTSEPKRHETRIRMSDSDIEKLEYCVAETGLNRAEIVRHGIDQIWAGLKIAEERRAKMYSFEDVNGNIIPFDNLNELRLELQRDIVSDKITAYLVEKEDSVYAVSKQTYDAIESKQ